MTTYIHKVTGAKATAQPWSTDIAIPGTTCTPHVDAHGEPDGGHVLVDTQSGEPIPGPHVVVDDEKGVRSFLTTAEFHETYTKEAATDGAATTQGSGDPKPAA
jgi:hypothetical protein